MPEAKQSQQLTQEIATVQRDIFVFPYMGILENLDETLKSRGRGKGLKIYDELERDCHAFAVLQKRKLAVTSRPWRVDPASEDARDREAAELVQRQLAALGFDILTGNLLDATLKGFAVTEVMWQVRGAELAAARIIPRNQRRFVFDEGSRLRMLSREKLWDGVELPPMKFLVHSVGAKDGSPYGLGLGHKLFWPVFFKKQDISFWLVFVDKFGSPTGLGKYPPSAPKADQTKLLDALKAIAQDAGIIVPQGMEIELLEAARSGSIDTYEKLARYMDQQISECVLGESITTTPGATGLGSGVAEVQNEVRLEVAKADADLLSDTLNATLVRWIVDLNFPGAGYPTVWRVFEQPADLEKRAIVDEKLHSMGYEPESVEYINETYGGKWRKKTAAESSPDIAAGGGGGASFAEREDQDLPDIYTERLHAQAMAAMDGLIEPVKQLVMRAASLEEVRDGLLDLYPEMDVAAFAEVMQRALAAAELAGRYEVSAEARQPGTVRTPDVSGKLIELMERQAERYREAFAAAAGGESLVRFGEKMVEAFAKQADRPVVIQSDITLKDGRGTIEKRARKDPKTGEWIIKEIPNG